MINRIQRNFVVIAIILSLTACNTVTPKPEPVARITLENYLSQSAVAANSGQTDKALSLLAAAAKDYPAEKGPWLQTAQIKFDASNYGDAIINAQETLQRDPSDKVANSIIAVSGLRVSTKALADLSRQNNLSGTLRTEAQDLAKLLRESLGETVLVPPTPVVADTSKRVRYVRKSAAAPNTASTQRPAVNNVPPKTASAEKDSTANPFGNLK